MTLYKQFKGISVADVDTVIRLINKLQYEAEDIKMDYACSVVSLGCDEADTYAAIITEIYQAAERLMADFEGFEFCRGLDEDDNPTFMIIYDGQQIIGTYDLIS